MSVNHPIKVKVDPKSHVVSFDHPSQHVFHKDKDTITWESDDGGISITFDSDPTGGTNPNPTAPKGHPTTPATMVGLPGDTPGTRYTYHAAVTGARGLAHGIAHGNAVIIFDDHGLDDIDTHGILNPIGDLETAASKAKTALADLISQLQTSAAPPAAAGIPKHDTSAFFFPFGINDIAITVTVGPVTVSVTVSGPGA